MAVCRRARSDAAGAAVVEFGILLVPLVLIVFGIIEFGLYFHRMQGMQAAAREGGRVAAVGLEASDVVDRVLEVAPPLIAQDDVEVSVEPDNHCASAGSEVTVTVTVSVVEARRAAYGLRIPFVPVLEEPSFASSAVFRCERTR